MQPVYVTMECLKRCGDCDGFGRQRFGTEIIVCRRCYGHGFELSAHRAIARYFPPGQPAR
jgi:DnaJ-class molecular chaperone